MGHSACSLQGNPLSRWSASADFCKVANFLAVEAGLVLGSGFSGLVISGVLLLIQYCGHEGGLAAF